MEIHHSKHHQGYVDKLNKALEGKEELEGKKVEELLMELESVSEDIKESVRNNGGGHWNHSFFWKLLKKDVEFSGEIKDLIEEKFGSFEEFKEEFTTNALSVFGSGWGWLVMDENKELVLMKTANQDTPISQGKIPLLGVDMWEHVHYKKWGPDKASYLESFFNVINWEQAEENLKMAKKR